MTYTSNPQLEQAFDYIQNTNQNIFLTGKAGTGKTTFLHRVKRECVKRVAVVAPTGIAAINAKGMTIHSLFQLPFGLHLPTIKKQPSHFGKKKINLIKSLDLLIIDEISMVRADVLDAIDKVLRRFKDYRKPFGGIQLLMIGDLHQLPPVVKNKDWKLLKDHYDSPYFFDSNAWKKTNPITIQLTHIYRQSDAVFINLLNKVRENQLDESVLATLNSRYHANFQPKKAEGYITLTALNRTAQAINEEQLRALSGYKYQFKAKITGEFPEHSFPTEEILEFKEGAQVLFIKNDREKRFFNGKIGQIIEIKKDKIFVKCPNDKEAIAVLPVEWKNVKYNLDETTKEITEDEKGSFVQYPLKLAWAITIHKSQGLTFEKAIIDAQAAFAHGQVYVALSRCKSFEGIVLRSPISFGSVKTDGLVKDYSEEAEKNAPDEAHLLTAKQSYQQELIRELFNFKQVRFALTDVTDVFMMNQQKLTLSAYQQVIDWEQKAEGFLFATAAKFDPILTEYFVENGLPETNDVLLQRIQKAGRYFANKIKKELLEDLRAIPIFADNQEVKATAEKALKILEKNIFIKHRCFKAVEKTAFSTQRHLQIKANAEIDFEQIYKTNKVKAALKIPKEVPHPTLYKKLYYWRQAKATEFARKPHDVISALSIIEMTKKLPVDKKHLEKISRFGSVKIKTFGKELMALIDDFCYENKLTPNLEGGMTNSSSPTAKVSSKANEITANSIPPKAYSVEKIRKTHPKAYEPWTEEEETELRKLKAKDKTVAYIAGVLGRNKGAINYRLKQLKTAGVGGGAIVFS